jgi:uncharacterized protein involved in type VI secretion and phage assembly
MTAAARSRTTDRRYYGVVEAIVMANSDTEGKEGRVKVKFPWFDDTMVTEWCRVSQLYAGSGYGTLFVPEEGDEVIVAFVHGDMRFPIIIGGVYNGQDKPFTYHDGTVRDEKLIRTKGRHEILLVDSQNKEKIRVKTKGEHEVALDDSGKKITITSKSKHAITLDDQGKKIEVQTAAGAKVLLEDQGTKITVQVGTESVVLEPAGVTIKSAAKVTVQAPQVAVEAPQVTLGAASGHQSLVMGEPFMAIFNAHTHVCTAPGTPSSPPVPPLTNLVFTQMTKAL